MGIHVRKNKSEWTHTNEKRAQFLCISKLNRNFAARKRKRESGFLSIFAPDKEKNDVYDRPDNRLQQDFCGIKRL